MTHFFTFKDLIQKLRYAFSNIQISTMLTTFGTLDPPLGNTRLQVVRLFSALLMCNDPIIAQEVVKLQLFNTLMVSVCVGWGGGGGGAYVCTCKHICGLSIMPCVYVHCMLMFVCNMCIDKYHSLIYLNRTCSLNIHGTTFCTCTWNHV